MIFGHGRINAARTIDLVIRHMDCPSDITADGVVDSFDLATLLSQWGDCPPESPCRADLDADGDVDPADLALLLASWGPCN